MAIKYLSKHHTADDPGGLIREVLQSGEEFAGPAEDILLAWTLRLESDQDPALVAERLIATYRLDERPAPGGACGRLIQLLRETAASPRGQLHSRQPRRKRRSARRPAG